MENENKAGTTAKQKIKKIFKYNRDYSISCILLLFFFVSALGWLWEVILCMIVKNGDFANRGFLYGPWLPVYGVGSIAVLLLLKPWRDRPIFVFFLTAVLCGVVEYVTAWILETLFQAKWWDYSNFLLNIQGRICLEILVLFALGGCLFLYIIAPFFAHLMDRIPKKIQIFTSIVLIFLLFLDLFISILSPNQEGQVGCLFHFF